MMFACNEKQERVHIDEAVRGNKYYCQICNSEVCIKRGNIKAHHFAHLSKSLCDSWHYDMSEWHSLWQKQFPENNQEIVFELAEKKHRADVFINNSIIEFQHSRISFEEFEERNKFYNGLGFKVVWIFDAREAYSNGNIQERFDGGFSWNNELIDLKTYNNKNVDIYLQEFDNIWNTTPNYKNISANNDNLSDYAWLHHIHHVSNGTPPIFYSDEEKNLFDYEFVDKYVNVKFLHDGSFDLNLDMRKKNYTINDISDQILTPIEYAFEIVHYIWCASSKHFVNPVDKCYSCKYFLKNKARCKFRFEKLLLNGFDKIINIKYSEDGKIEYVVVLKNRKRYKINYDKVPKAIFTIKEAFEEQNNTQVIRVRNINTGWKVQITKYNYDMMMKNNKCFGKVQGPEIWNMSFSKKELEIFSFNRREWEIIWRK